MLTSFEKYQALINRDSSFEGVFIAAVKTSGIFCRTTCTAKKPKIENVEFFETTKDAILKGYRPCKICNPLEILAETPSYIKEILQELNSYPSQKLKDWNLRERGIVPAKMRRWFLKNHGITFHAYQRMFRLNSAFHKIQLVENVFPVALDSGYESLSEFNNSFKNIFGVSPSNNRDKKVVHITRIESPLGSMFAGATDDGICLLEFTDRKMLETELKSLSKIFNATIIQGEHAHFIKLRIELVEYFEGTRKDFSVPLFTPGSEFQKIVWKELQKIPYGTTRSYKQQSIALKNPLAIRAIAHANGMNRIAIIIPCHRVIGEDGSMTGYGGGIWRKKWLLEFEGVIQNTRTKQMKLL